MTMSADDFTTALVTNGQAWLTLSIAAILPMIWGFALVLHFSRPYTIRFLKSLTLRFGSDVWWLGYVLMRDAFLVITLALSLPFFFPDIYIGLGLPITAPLATEVLLWALTLKFLRDSDEDPRVFKQVSSLLILASVLYIVPQVYGLEAADQGDRLATFGLGGLPGTLQAHTDAGVNPLAWPILVTSLVLFGLTSAYLFVRLALRSDGTETSEGAPAAA